MSQWNRGQWHLVITALGVLLILGAVVRGVYTALGDGVILAVVLNVVLMSVPGLVMVSIGLWLPTTDIRPELHRRVVGWTVGGVIVMGIVLALRVIHPGVTVEFAHGTQVVSLAIGSVAGLAIGVHDGRAISHARRLEERNEALREKREVERQNERLRRTERRLEEAIDRLEASNERLEQFAYAVSHDLQEPLRMVTSYLQLVERRYADELDEEGEEFIDYAVDGAERMREMIDGLLEYSRVDTQGDPFESVDLDDVLDDVLADLQFRIEETDAEVARDPLPTVEGDRNQLRQLLQNLLSNAIDYSGDEPPRIRVSAEWEGPRWTIAVSDEGIGIDPDDADRIFGIFQRLHSIEDHDGSGIGLALCERIVERHGGEIWVDSEPGEGSTFYVTLPPADDPSNGPDGDSRAESETDRPLVDG